MAIAQSNQALGDLVECGIAGHFLVRAVGLAAQRAQHAIGRRQVGAL
ncbi:hypothetical protein [Sphingomonas sp. CCH9-H8]|nr:hypothetical protein [Sphingomonas sp. CCH9-H8]